MLSIHQERVQCNNANKILASNVEFQRRAAEGKTLIQAFLQLPSNVRGAMSANELFPVIDAIVRDSWSLLVEALRTFGSQKEIGVSDQEAKVGASSQDETILVVEYLLTNLEMYSPTTLERLVTLLFQLTSRGNKRTSSFHYANVRRHAHSAPCYKVLGTKNNKARVAHCYPNPLSLRAPICGTFSRF